MFSRMTTSKIRCYLALLLSAIIFTATSCSIHDMTKSNKTNEVRKSPNDSREYKTLILSNQMEVLLISDPDSDQAVVSLDVLAGQIHDPKERQGLAHFLEHMLFLGNEKYPEPDAFGSYLSSHGGSSNAYTAYEDTNYFFSIQNNYLEGAIDRFSQFFISPLFDFTLVERELNAVNSEHTKNINDDRRRIHRIVKFASNQDHPFSQFGTGSIESLKNSDQDYNALRKSLITFFEQHYSANLMKLVIYGKDPVDKLEKLAKTYFSPVENRQLEKKSFSDIPLIADSLPRKISIKPVKEMRQLRLSFKMPSYREYYASKTTAVVSMLLGEEGGCSVLDWL